MSALSLSIRLLHVLGMALLVGGGAFVWYGLWREVPVSRALLVRFEWAVWGTIGVVFVTGVGNLGAVGAPGPGTRWGAILSVKLAFVVAFAIVSFVRTLAVLRLPAGKRPVSHRVLHLHAVSVTILLGIVVLAEVLAHG